MTTISQLRRRIAVLKRKLALEIALVKLNPLADEYSLQCTFAEYKKEPWPCPWKFARHLRR